MGHSHVVLSGLMLLLVAACLAAEDRPRVVQEILDSVRANVDRAKAEYGRKVKAENDKVVTQIRKAMEAATKAGKLDEAVALKAALEKAGTGEYLDEMLAVDAGDLLGDGDAVDRDALVFRKATLAKSGWAIAGGVEFAKDPALGAEVAVLRAGCLYRENFAEIQNGPFFVAMWLKHESGVGGSYFGIGAQRKDDFSLVGLGEGRLGTWSGWPANGKVTSAMAIPVGAWTYLACQCDKTGMTIYIDGKEAGKIAVPPQDNRMGRLEIGVNSPGGDEYTNMSVGTLRLMPGKIVPADAVPRYMKSDHQLLVK